VSFSGQFELLEHANKKLKLMVPMTVMIIFILLYLAFRRVDEALLILMSLPFALVGGIWFLYWQGFHMSVATGTGFIALAGVAAEFGVVMLMYLRHAIEAHRNCPVNSHRKVLMKPSIMVPYCVSGRKP
jgi:Cu(I)/Ag(I) efflux system membrane protein CusA/SilA